MTVPGYIDNSTISRSNTIQIRGNTVSDLQGGTVVAFNIAHVDNVLVKNNKALRIRSTTGSAVGFKVDYALHAIFLYNVASRTNYGFYLTNVATLDVYNATAHNCTRGFYVDGADGTFKNISISAYPDSSLYRVAVGIYSGAGFTQDVDYTYHAGLAALVESGTVTQGTIVEEKRILYLDEPNDDLTPDYISELVNTGTSNPIYDAPDIGGVETTITDEVTTKLNYFYDLIDNTFWDIDNEKAAEVSLIKAFQSRVLAASEVDERNMERDLYLNQMISSQRFSSLFPMYARYVSSSIFAKSVRNMFYATQNPATLESYNSAIGGYNVFPSFFQRMEDNVESWIIDESYVDDDNWLSSYWGLQYGIFIDVLGTATMSTAASGECYNNVQNCVSDIAPVGWFLHSEQQPTDYFLFTEGWNGFEDCALTNMHYNDDYGIEVTDITANGTVVTPVISTFGPAASGVSTITVGPSGGVEISLLDRVYSENITRKFYYRTGNDPSIMGTWTELTHRISGYFYTLDLYIQFKITVEDVLRVPDYEFVALCTRPYNPARYWS
jgi:hypothetical protein